MKLIRGEINLNIVIQLFVMSNWIFYLGCPREIGNTVNVDKNSNAKCISSKTMNLRQVFCWIADDNLQNMHLKRCGQ